MSGWNITFRTPRVEHYQVRTDENGEAVISYPYSFVNPVVTLGAFTEDPERRVTAEVVESTLDGCVIQTKQEGLSVSMSGVMVTTPSVVVSADVDVTVAEKE